jgi:hypothetical protein
MRVEGEDNKNRRNRRNRPGPRLSSRPERHADLVSTTSPWRGVEGSRGTFPDHIATGSSSQGSSRSPSRMATCGVGCRKRGMFRTPIKSFLLASRLLRLPALGERLEALWAEDSAPGSLHSAPGDFLKGQGSQGAPVGMTDIKGIGERVTYGAGLVTDRPLPGRFF